jgi:multicomponent Na+:H+ antiporter subunit B
MITYLEILLSVLLGATAVSLVFTRDLFGVTVLLSVYSGLIGVVLSLLGAVDVAFTEAVVGAGLSTGLLLSLLRYLRADVNWVTLHARLDRPRPHFRNKVAMLVALAVGAVLTVAVHALPEFGNPSSPAHQRVAALYLERSVPDAKTPNAVTAVLADYRSFDTLIETSVVLTGAVACVLILRKYRRPNEPTT